MKKPDSADRPPDPRLAQTREALIQAAETALRDTPLDQLTVGEIARRAGVAVSSIYNHFGSKAGLQAAIAERALVVDREYMDRAYGDRGSPVDQLKTAAAEYLRFYLDHPDYFRLLAFPPEPGQSPAARELNAQIAQRVDEQNARTVEALRQGVAAGLIRDVDPEAVATILWASWNGMISLGWRPDGLRRSHAELEAMVATATDIVTEGLLRK